MNSAGPKALGHIPLHNVPELVWVEQEIQGLRCDTHFYYRRDFCPRGRAVSELEELDLVGVLQLLGQQDSAEKLVLESRLMDCWNDAKGESATQPRGPVHRLHMNFVFCREIDQHR